MKEKVVMRKYQGCVIRGSPRLSREENTEVKILNSMIMLRRENRFEEIIHKTGRVEGMENMKEV
jgi:hypothetical protein